MGFDWISLLLWYGVFVFTTTLHEAAHAWAALKLGDNTAYLGGQVTLDPAPHIRREPVGMVVVPMLSWLANGWMIGWASAPYDPSWARAYPKRAALMAAAGPLADLLLVVVSALGIRAGLAAGVFSLPHAESFGFTHLVSAESSGFWSAIAALLSLIFSLNLLLGVFNLLPVPPLDGASLALLLLPPRAAAMYLDFMSRPGISLLGLLVAWKLFGSIFSVVWGFGLDLLYAGTAIGY